MTNGADRRAIHNQRPLCCLPAILMVSGRDWVELWGPVGIRPCDLSSSLSQRAQPRLCSRSGTSTLLPELLQWLISRNWQSLKYIGPKSNWKRDFCLLYQVKCRAQDKLFCHVLCQFSPSFCHIMAAFYIGNLWIFLKINWSDLYDSQ